MGFYAERILPHLLDLAMRNRNLAEYRRRVVPSARGRILEIGIGSGLNLPFYGTEAQEVIGLDPSPRLLHLAERHAGESPVPVRMLGGSAEAIPLESGTVDTVVTTWTLCSIPDAHAALAEMLRVLRPAGALMFVEHGRAPDRAVAGWQDRLTPLWRPVAGGCHLNRPIESLIREAGFTITDLRLGYMRGPRPFTFMYEGRAARS